MMAEKRAESRRDDLDPRMRAISDTLDEVNVRGYGRLPPWNEPELFLELLEEREYTVIRKGSEA